MHIKAAQHRGVLHIQGLTPHHKLREIMSYRIPLKRSVSEGNYLIVLFALVTMLSACKMK